MEYYPGKLIVIEGLDGSGKSTQSQILQKKLNSLGKKTYLSIKPTQFLIGGLIRSRLANDWECSPECLQSLFLADHLFSLEKEIIPKLKQGINVISDRYIYSTFAYGAINCDREWLKNINKNIPKPDITIFLDLSADKCIDRIKKERFSTELYEKKELLEKIRENYFESFKVFKTDAIITNGDDKIENISKKIITTITNLEDTSFDSDCL